VKHNYSVVGSSDDAAFRCQYCGNLLYCCRGVPSHLQQYYYYVNVRWIQLVLDDDTQTDSHTDNETNRTIGGDRKSTTSLDDVMPPPTTILLLPAEYDSVTHRQRDSQCRSSYTNDSTECAVPPRFDARITRLCRGFSHSRISVNEIRPCLYFW